MKTALIFISLTLALKLNFGFNEKNILPIATVISFPKALPLKAPIWTESLSDFREALLNVDVKTVKQFFEFPILNPGNDIWMVADMKNASRMTPSKVVPFKESDFNKHFSDILATDFRKTFEKLDIEKLSKEKKAESPELEIVSPAKSKMKAVYIESKKIITLSLITKSPEFGQFTIDYHFKILPSGAIRFTHVKFNM
jgi:hypothetical protein